MQSEVGIGTDVMICLPLCRVPGTGTPVTTPSSAADLQAADSIKILIRDHQGASVGLVGFEIDTSGLGPVLKRCIEDWYGFNTINYVADTKEFSADVLIVDERAFNLSLSSIPAGLPVIVLCNNTTRNQIAKRAFESTILEMVSKPFGPHKIAKTLRISLERARGLERGVSGPKGSSVRPSETTESDEATPMPAMNNLVLETGMRTTPFEVQTNGVVTASDSQNATMALDKASSQSTSDEMTVTEDHFPFSVQENNTEILHQSQNDPEPQAARWPTPETRFLGPITRIPITSSKTDQGTNVTALTGHQHSSIIQAAKIELRNERNISNLTASNIALLNGGMATEEAPLAGPVKHVPRPPKLLLVDDNQINLRLLETCMKKRKYQFVDTAEDGQLAVQAAEAHEDGYDIIFMGKSIPLAFLP